MPDMDSPTAKNVSAIITERTILGSTGSGGGAGGEPALRAVQLTKRPREEMSPVPGKRGRGETGDTLTLQVPHGSAPILSVQTGSGNTTPPVSAPPPLLESPSKLNRASPLAPAEPSSSSSPTPTGFSQFSGASGMAKQTTPRKSDMASTPEITWGRAVRRKTLTLPKALPSLAATDPVFHAALLRLLHRRGGKTCPEALGWRWCGDAPARFDHWPCALHPDLMNLLAYISSSEERVVLTGCDLKGKKEKSGNCSGNGQENEENPTLLPPPLRREPSPWRAATSPRYSRGRGSSWGTQPAAVAAAVVLASSPPVDTKSTTAAARTTPVAPRVLASFVTPSSALRRPTGATSMPASRARSSAKSRGVRFSTHDMSVVDTPDPIRGGSEEGMLSALGGLQSILSAAERVRSTAGFGSSTVGCLSLPSSAAGAHEHGLRGTCGNGGVDAGEGGQFEGYFDRFSITGSSGRRRGKREKEADNDVTNLVTSTDLEIVASTPEEAGGDCGAAEAKRVKEDLVALVSVLDEIASSDAAPGELILESGWGPEHSNATAFYVRELAMLCGIEEEVPAGLAGAEAAAATATPGAALVVRAGGGAAEARASHLRVRYLDVLSCLIRYNLKLLLNLCTCEAPQEVEADDDDEFLEDDVVAATAEPAESATDAKTTLAADAEHEKKESNSATPSSTGLTVVVPGRVAALSRGNVVGTAMDVEGQQQQRKPCSCVTVVDGTGALEFNTEDVAALLTLALRHLYPFMPLAERLAAVAAAHEQEAEPHTRMDHDGEELDETEGSSSDEDNNVLDDRLWAAMQQYTAEYRAAAGAAVVASPTAKASSATDGACPAAELFSETCVPKCATGTVSQGNAWAAAAGVGPSVVVVDTQGSLPALETEDGSASGLTVDEATDLLEYVAAARFVAQLLSEPVVADSISSGRWAQTESLAKQVQQLAEAERSAIASRGGGGGGGGGLGTLSSLSDMLCLGALADVEGLGERMAQQARFAPALEAALKGELRQANRRGQGRQRRLKSRLQQINQQAIGFASTGMLTFPMIRPCCCSTVHGAAGLECRW